MGNAKTTSTHDLDRAGHELLGSFYRGAFPAGSEPVNWVQCIRSFRNLYGRFEQSLRALVMAYM